MHEGNPLRDSPRPSMNLSFILRDTKSLRAHLNLEVVTKLRCFARPGKRVMKNTFSLILLVAALMMPGALRAGNQVMGEIEFQGKSKIEKTSGVWVDGQYVGYLKELKGSKKVLLLPGEHVITVRQDGYRDFEERVSLRPGEKRVVRVAMEKGPTGTMPAATATVKIAVNPTRAAVFVDGLFVGHAAEFQGMGRGLLIAPGTHTLKISLPGYQTFETQISPLAHQKVEVKTNLIKSSGSGDEPLIHGSGGEKTPPAPPPDRANSPQGPSF